MAPEPSASPTQQHFDLSSFRKELKRRRDAAEDRMYREARSGNTEQECLAEGEKRALEDVLALLPAEEETG